MLKRLVVVMICCFAASVSIDAQTASGPASKASSASAPSASSAKKYTPPRTPWGDPDLQGNYTNKYEQGTPFERPDEFAGRTIQEVKNDELKDILQERQDRALLSITLAGGDPAGNLGGPLWWQDQFEVGKGSRPWLVTDPSDGKIPPMLPQGQQRIAARTAAIRATRGAG